MPRALNSRPSPHNNSTQKSESTLEGLNLSNRFLTKSRRSKPSSSNLSNLSPLDLTISNETMMTVGATANEEATEATLATMVETMAMTIIAKAKTTQIGDDIPMTRISPVIYMEGDTIQKNVLYSRGRLANSRHLAEISNETRTATTSPTSTIASCWIKIYHINGLLWQQTNPQRCHLRPRMLRTNPVAHEAPATVWCRFRIHLSRRIRNSRSKQRIFPWKISQRCTLHLGINLSRLQCCNHAQRLQKAKNHRNR
jgi:hypothetical protein